MLLACDTKEVFRAILTDLSKAFDCIIQDRLVAKVHAYAFDRNGLKVIHYYLLGKSQKTKLGSSSRKFLDMIYGGPQGFILGPIFLNINLHELFPSEYSFQFTSFEDDTTPCECGKS